MQSKQSHMVTALVDALVGMPPTNMNAACAKIFGRFISLNARHWNLFLAFARRMKNTQRDEMKSSLKHTERRNGSK